MISPVEPNEAIQHCLFSVLMPFFYLLISLRCCAFGQFRKFDQLSLPIRTKSRTCSNALVTTFSCIWRRLQRMSNLVNVVMAVGYILASLVFQNSISNLHTSFFLLQSEFISFLLIPSQITLITSNKLVSNKLR